MIKKEECQFFHVIELPSGETTPGAWDFRETEREYHGGYEFAGKSVLELGSATGSHSFWLEKQGAIVTPYDLSPEHGWDVLLTASQKPDEVDNEMRTAIRKLNNGWWYCRDRLGSKLELTHGSIYDVPADLGDFDVVTFGSVLLHVSDPIRAVQRAAPRARETIIIMESYAKGPENNLPFMWFLPKLGNERPWGAWAWWRISPKLLENVLKIIGFNHFQLTITSHRCPPSNKSIELYTLVATR